MGPLANSGIIDTLNGAPIYSDYIPTLPSIAEDCKKIITFLNAIHKQQLSERVRLEENLLNKKFQLLQNAVQPNQNLDYKNKELFFQIMDLLADLPVEERQNKVWSPAILRIATIAAKLSDVDRAIQDISLFLIPTTRKFHLISKEDLQRSCHIIAFAHKYFEILDEDKKISLLQIKTLLQQDQPIDFKAHKVHFSAYEFLRNALAAKVHSAPPSPAVKEKAPSPAPLQWQEPKRTHSEPIPRHEEPKEDIIDALKNKLKTFGDLFSNEKKATPFLNECSLEGFVVLAKNYSEDDDEKIRATLYAASKIKKRQVDIFAELTHLFIHHYGRTWYTQADDTALNLIVDQYLKDFDKLIPQFILRYFFQEPRGISDREKSFLSALFDALAHFFGDLKDDEKFKAGNYEFSPATAQMIDKALIHIIDELLDFFLPTFDTEDLEKVYIHQLIKKTLSTILFKGVDNILTPYNFSLFIDRLLEDNIDLTGPEEHLPSLNTFPEGDEKFSAALGDAFYRIGQVLIDLGNPSWMMNSASSILLSILEKKKLKLGRWVQKGLCRLTNSECSMIPFLLLRHVFFNKINDTTYVPTLLGTVYRTETEKKEVAAKVELKIKNKLYPIIIQQIKSQSQVAAKLMNSFSSIEDFCNTLSSKLFKITQNKVLLKILLSYILKSLSESLKKPQET